MPMNLEGSCQCGAVRFTLASHAPVPYQRCYCTICRKTAGTGGFAINIGGIAASLQVAGAEAVGVFRAALDRDGATVRSTERRHYCTRCGTALWITDPGAPDSVFPFAAAIDTALPAPPEQVHIMLSHKAPWVTVPEGPEHRHFNDFPEETIADWHKARDLWMD